MLSAYPDLSPAGSRTSESASPDPASDSLAGAGWVDLLDPTAEEIRRVEAALGLRLPTRGEISEIEATSRLRAEDGALYMSAPLISGIKGEIWKSAPTGFVVCRHSCITLRYEKLAAFDAVAAELRSRPKLEPGEALVALLDEIVDRAADRLELTAEDLTKASQTIFHDQADTKARLSHRTDSLRRLMIEVGRTSEHMSQVRYALVCIGRMAQFVTDRGHDWVTPVGLERLAAIRTDVASLQQFEENLLGRVQLLQDAATAFISIDQNEVVKVLTIASVVGIPPVLIVGIYGMNFKLMPELSWRFGYPYALALIVVSVLIPRLWFKMKDWM